MEGARLGAHVLDGLKEDNWTSQLALGRARRAPCFKERKLKLHRPDVPALESAPVQVSCNHMQSHAITCNHMQSDAIACNPIQSDGMQSDVNQMQLEALDIPTSRQPVNSAML